MMTQEELRADLVAMFSRPKRDPWPPPVTLSDRSYVHATRVRYVGTRTAEQLQSDGGATPLDLAVCIEGATVAMTRHRPGEYALFVEGQWRRAELTDDDRVFFEPRPDEPTPATFREVLDAPRKAHRDATFGGLTAVPDDAVFLVCEPGTSPTWRAIADACEREWMPSPGRVQRKIRNIVAQPRDYAHLVQQAQAAIRYAHTVGGEAFGSVDGVMVRWHPSRQLQLVTSYGEWVDVLARDFMRGTV